MKKLLFIAGAVVVLAGIGAGVYWWYPKHQAKVSADDALPAARPDDPASIFCGTLRGEATVKKEKDATVVTCKLPDGKTCKLTVQYTAPYVCDAK